MARSNETEELKKHTLHLYAGDFDKLASFYPDLGPSVAVRRIIRKHLKQLEAQVTSLPTLESLDV